MNRPKSMTMTRKHFIKLAETIAKIDNDTDRAVIARSIGVVCADSKKHFDWVRWYSACNVEVDNRNA